MAARPAHPPILGINSASLHDPSWSRPQSISPMSATFRLNGLQFIALNGGPQYKFGVSWQVIPPVPGDMLNDEDDAKSQHVMARRIRF